MSASVGGIRARALAIALGTSALATMPPLATQTPGAAAGDPQAKPAADVAAGTARIRGRVVHADTGSPLRRAEVSLRGGGVRREVTTDRDGRYEFSGVPAGRVTISASKTGHLSCSTASGGPSPAVVR